MPHARRFILRAALVLFLQPALAAGPVSADGTRMLVVTCTPASGVPGDRAEAVCDEFLQVLATTLPALQPRRGAALDPDRDGLAVRVDAATEASVGLQLTWHPRGKPAMAARPLALSVMDRTLSPALRQDFYRTLLADAAIPL